MAIADLKKDAVLRAIDYWDSLTKEEFFKRFPANDARTYFILHKGDKYPLKAILTAAHKIQYPKTPFESINFNSRKGYKVAEDLDFEAHIQAKSPDEEVNILSELEEPFDPKSPSEGKKRVLRSIAERRGQASFRKKLMIAYEKRCAISGCKVMEALDAAHIVPYDGAETNNVTNGLLLRTDLHTLFDLYLITVDAQTKKLVMSKQLFGSEYWQYNGKLLKFPNAKLEPSSKALAMHQEEYKRLHSKSTKK